MELRHLRHFVAVARTLHFGRAADSLRIAQPALSQSIRKLEEELGVLLLRRTNRRVELTEAGGAFLADAGEILMRAERALENARLAASGKRGRLRLAYIRSAPEGLPTQIADAFRCANPEVDLQINTGFTARNIEELRAGGIDVAFVRPPLYDTEGIECLTIGEEPFVVVLPSSHRLARRRRLKREDIEAEPLVTGLRERGPGFFDSMFRQVWGEERPRVVQIEPDEEHILRAVARGKGISVITATRAATLRTSGVVVRRFADPQPTAALGLVWLRGPMSSALASFVALARTT